MAYTKFADVMVPAGYARIGFRISNENHRFDWELRDSTGSSLSPPISGTLYAAGGYSYIPYPYQATPISDVDTEYQFWIDYETIGANITGIDNTVFFPMFPFSGQVTTNIHLTGLDNYVSGLVLPNIGIVDINGLSTMKYLTSLDVSKNAIIDVDLSNLPLTNFDISDNPNLESLGLSNLGLNTVDISEFTKLATLDISDNSLTDLDITNNLLLTSLDVSNNSLTTDSLDSIVSQIYNTRLTGGTLDMSGQATDTVSNTGYNDATYLANIYGWTVSIDYTGDTTSYIRNIFEFVDVNNTPEIDHYVSNTIDASEYGVFTSNPINTEITGSIDGQGYQINNLTIEHDSTETYSTIFGAGITSIKNIKFRHYKNSVVGGDATMICGIAPDLPATYENVVLEDCEFKGGVPIYGVCEDLTNPVDKIELIRVSLERSDVGNSGVTTLVCEDVAAKIGTVSLTDCRATVSGDNVFGVSNTISSAIGKVDITGLKLGVIGITGSLASNVAGVCQNLLAKIDDIKVYGSFSHTFGGKIAGVALTQFSVVDTSKLDVNLSITAEDSTGGEISAVFNNCFLNQTTPSLTNAWISANINAPYYEIGGVCHTISLDSGDTTTDYTAFSQLQVHLDAIGATVSGIANTFLDGTGNSKVFSDIVIDGSLNGSVGVAGLFAEANEFTLSAVAPLVDISGRASNKKALVLDANKDIKVDTDKSVVWLTNEDALGGVGTLIQLAGTDDIPAYQITEAQSKLKSSYVGWDFSLVQAGVSMFDVPTDYTGVNGIVEYATLPSEFYTDFPDKSIFKIQNVYYVKRSGGQLGIVSADDWEETTTYFSSFYYIFNNVVYYCKLGNTGIEPEVTLDWEDYWINVSERTSTSPYRAYLKDERFTTSDGRYFVATDYIPAGIPLPIPSVIEDTGGSLLSGIWQIHNTFTIPYLRLWSTIVPSLQNSTAEVADALISANSLNKGDIAYQYDTILDGLVVNQSIAAGTIVPHNTYIGYTLAIRVDSDTAERLPNDSFFAPRSGREMATFIADHLPPGRLFATAYMNNTNINQLLRTMGTPLLGVEGLLSAFTADYKIDTSTTLLDRWEGSVLLPNEATKQITDIDQRRSFVRTRFAKLRKRNLNEIQTYMRDATGYTTLTVNTGIEDSGLSNWQASFTLSISVSESEIGSTTAEVTKNAEMIEALLREVLPAHIVFGVEQPERNSVRDVALTDRTNHTITIEWTDPEIDLLEYDDPLEYIVLSLVGDEVGKPYTTEVTVGAGIGTYTFEDLQNATNYTVTLTPYYLSGFYGRGVSITHTGAGTTTTNVLSNVIVDTLTLNIPFTNVRNYCRLV